MKIALVSDNGESLSQHFGRARFYVVVTVENGQEVNREVRDKQGQHGFSPEAQHRHGGMIEAINDCEALVAGGMGAGAPESLQARVEFVQS